MKCGTISMYTNGKCRCEECRECKRIYEAKRLMGRVRTMVPAHNVRRHLRFLISNGWSGRAIADKTGIPRPTVNKLATGVTKHVDSRTEKKLLAINTSDAPYKGRPNWGVQPKWKKKPSLESQRP